VLQQHSRRLDLVRRTPDSVRQLRPSAQGAEDLVSPLKLPHQPLPLLSVRQRRLHKPHRAAQPVDSAWAQRVLYQGRRALDPSRRCDGRSDKRRGGVIQSCGEDPVESVETA